MAEILLQNGMKVIVDDEDYERVNQHNWSIGVTGEKSRIHVHRIGLKNGKSKTISLSRYILGLENKTDFVKHINNNPFDHQKNNLEVVTLQSVRRRRKGQRNSSSKYKGVSYRKRENKWVANIYANGKAISLGYFDSEDEAALAYNSAAVKLFGEDAYQNVIGIDNSAKTIELGKGFSPRSKKRKKTFHI